MRPCDDGGVNEHEYEEYQRAKAEILQVLQKWRRTVTPGTTGWAFLLTDFGMNPAMVAKQLPPWPPEE